MSVPSIPPYTKVTSVVLSKDADVVDLGRAASYGNSEELFKNRVFHDENDLIISFRSETWPRYAVLTLDVSPVTIAVAEALEDFYYDHLGELVDLTVNNVVYTGVIQEPKLEVVDERNDNCNFKVAITLETEVSP